MKRQFLLIIYIVTSFIYVVNLWFTISGIFLFFTTVFVFGALIFFPKKFKVVNRIDYYTCLCFTLILFTILSFTLEATDVNGLQSLAMWLGRFLMFLATLISFLYFLNVRSIRIFKFLKKNKFVILILISLLIQLSFLKIVKVPDVDIYRITKYGPLNLVAGKNPYEFTGGHYEYYTYGPASIFLFLPFDVFFKDPRFLLIISNLFVAFCLYKICLKSFHGEKEAEILSLIYLYHPRYPNLLISTSTDVLIVGLLAFALLSFAYKHFYRFGLGLGLLVGIKILFAIPLIFFLKYSKFPFRKTVVAGVALLLLCYIPFLVANSNAVIFNTVLFFFTQKETLFLQKAVVTLASFINRQWSLFPPSYVFPIINVIMIIVLWVKIKPTNKFSSVLAIIGFVFLISLFLSQLALPGYYFVASSFLLFAIAFDR